MPAQHTICFTFIDQQLLDVMENAHSNYWIHEYRPLYDRAAGMLALKPMPGVTRPVRVQVTPEDIANALRNMLSYDHASNAVIDASDIRRAATDCIAGMTVNGCEADGPTCDSVLQFAVFGKLVFG